MKKLRIHDCTVLAAVLRASLKCGISTEKGSEYMNFIFDALDIPCDTGFEDLLGILQDESMWDRFAEAAVEYDDCDGLADFFAALFDTGNKPDDDSVGTSNATETVSEEILTDGGLETIEFDDAFMEMFGIGTPDEIIAVEECLGDYDSSCDRLNILGCEIREMRLPDMQLVSYIDIPMQPFEVLKSDFRFAEHFSFLEEIAERFNSAEKTRIMFVVENRQTGLLACSYISTLLDQDKYDNCPVNEDIEDNDEVNAADDYKSKADFSGKMPIINASELRGKEARNIYGRLAYSDGGMGVQQAVIGRSIFVPWFEKYPLKCPLIVMIDKEQFLPPDLHERIKYLGEKFDDIFIVCCVTCDEKNDESDITDISALGAARMASVAGAAEDISFETLFDTYSIEEPDITSEYYKKVLIDAAAAEGYAVDKNVNLDEVLKNLKKYRAHSWNANLTILRLVRKVISCKHDHNDSKILDEKDFEFLKSSMFVLNRQKNKKAVDRENAVEKMNREIYGLEHVKKTILETVCVLKLSDERQKAGLKPLQINNTFVFLGPPGVGKTKMAEHLTNILFENNLLPDRRFISINAAQLKGLFVGHTAPKVTAIFENYDAIFLDEAYSLASQNADKGLDTFSQEALAQLCVELEKHSRDKLVIFAGYGGDVDGKNNKMKEFLSANPGIASRITFTVEFPSYSPDVEMPEILKRIALNEDYDLEEGWREIAVNFFRKRARSESYGNGREARRLFQNAVVVQATRLYGKKADIAQMRLITCEDLKTAAEKLLKDEEHIAGRKEEKRRIGFCFYEY